MARGIDIPVRAPGAKQAAGDLDRVAQAERRVGAAGQAAGTKVKRGMGGVGKLVGRIGTAVTGMLGSFLGISGAMRALNILKEELRDIETTTENAARSTRSLLALSAVKRGGPEMEKQLEQFMRISSETDIGAGAAAMYGFYGGTAGMAPKRKQEVLMQAGLFRKTDPRMTSEAAVSLFSVLATQNPQLTPQQLGNLASRTIEQAKATPEEMAQYLPDIMTTAKAGKVDPAVAAAMFSFATRRGGGVAKSGTSVRSAMIGLLAPSKDIAKEAAAYGYPTGGTAEDKLEWMATRGKDISDELAFRMGGRRGLQMIAGMASEPGALRRETAMMRGALGAKGSLLEERITKAMGADEKQGYLEALTQARITKQFQQIQPEVLREEAQIAIYENILRQQGVPTLFRKVAVYRAEAQRIVGMDPFTDDPGMRAYLENVGRVDEQALMGRAMQINHGGTHHHNHGPEDPAGRPVRRVPE